MPHHETIALSGIVEHVFVHRFTLEAGGETYLADLTPKGAEAFALRRGLRVALEGERRPSEIKVTRIAADGGDAVHIHHKKPHHAPGHARPDVAPDPALALLAVRQAGWTPSSDGLRQRPKHFEVLARQGDGGWMELHVDAAGTIYKQKAPDPAKWGTALG